jgi:hypothetical protein
MISTYQSDAGCSQTLNSGREDVIEHSSLYTCLLATTRDKIDTHFYHYIHFHRSHPQIRLSTPNLGCTYMDSRRKCTCKGNYHLAQFTSHLDIEGG